MPVALLLDNGYLTDVRTGASGAVAADLLARPAIETVGVIGSGVQARHQVRCLREVRSFTRLVAWSIDPDGLLAYCDEMRDTLGLDAFAAAGPEAVARAADVLITATPAHAAIVMVGWVRPGTHVTALGSDGPGKQELDPRLVAAADLFVVDRLSQCRRLGELQHALAARLMREEDVYGELGQIVAGNLRGRVHDRELTVADLTGVGFQDTAIASLAYETLTSRT